MQHEATGVRLTRLLADEAVPVLGQGTWYMAEHPHRRETEVRALRLGLDLGLRLIDTAEMYADGAAEELVGGAIVGRRDEVFLVSKVMPNHATTSGTISACERSLRRLRTDRLDLYLLHWRASVPLAETLQAFDTLHQRGLIRYWGVSNFDVSDMQELVGLSGERAVATDQVLYNLGRRGIEYDLSPWCRARQIPIMAYSPIEQGRILNAPVLRQIAARHEATAAQIALAWVVREDGVIAIPKAGDLAHVRENREALDLQLTEQDLAELDQAFPPPAAAQVLEML